MSSQLFQSFLIRNVTTNPTLNNCPTAPFDKTLILHTDATHTTCLFDGLLVQSLRSSHSLLCTNSTVSHNDIVIKNQSFTETQTPLEERVSFVSCNFSNCHSATKGGSIFYSAPLAGRLTLNKCVFTASTSDESGGSIATVANEHSNDIFFALQSCSFTGSNSKTGKGAVLFSTISSSILSTNITSSPAADCITNAIFINQDFYATESILFDQSVKCEEGFLSCPKVTFMELRSVLFVNDEARDADVPFTFINLPDLDQPEYHDIDACSFYLRSPSSHGYCLVSKQVSSYIQQRLQSCVDVSPVTRYSQLLALETQTEQNPVPRGLETVQVSAHGSDVLYCGLTLPCQTITYVLEQQLHSSVFNITINDDTFTMKTPFIPSRLCEELSSEANSVVTGSAAPFFKDNIAAFTIRCLTFTISQNFLENGFYQFGSGEVILKQISFIFTHPSTRSISSNQALFFVTEEQTNSIFFSLQIDGQEIEMLPCYFADILNVDIFDTTVNAVKLTNTPFVVLKSNLTISLSSFTDIECSSCLFELSTASVSLLISTSFFTNCRSTEAGCCFVLTTKTHLQIENSAFSHNIANYGSCVYVVSTTKASQLETTSSTLRSIDNPDGEGFNLLLDSVLFDQNHAKVNAVGSDIFISKGIVLSSQTSIQSTYSTSDSISFFMEDAEEQIDPLSYPDAQCEVTPIGLDSCQCGSSFQPCRTLQFAVGVQNEKRVQALIVISGLFLEYSVICRRKVAIILGQFMTILRNVNEDSFVFDLIESQVQLESLAFHTDGTSQGGLCFITENSALSLLRVTFSFNTVIVPHTLIYQKSGETSMNDCAISTTDTVSLSANHLFHFANGSCFLSIVSFSSILSEKEPHLIHSVLHGLDILNVDDCTFMDINSTGEIVDLSIVVTENASVIIQNCVFAASTVSPEQHLIYLRCENSFHDRKGALELKANMFHEIQSDSHNGSLLFVEADDLGLVMGSSCADSTFYGVEWYSFCGIDPSMKAPDSLMPYLLGILQTVYLDNTYYTDALDCGTEEYPCLTFAFAQHSLPSLSPNRTYVMLTSITVDVILTNTHDVVTILGSNNNLEISSSFSLSGLPVIFCTKRYQIQNMIVVPSSTKSTLTHTIFQCTEGSLFLLMITIHASMFPPTLQLLEMNRSSATVVKLSILTDGQTQTNSSTPFFSINESTINITQSLISYLVLSSSTVPFINIVNSSFLLTRTQIMKFYSFSPLLLASDSSVSVASLVISDTTVTSILFSLQSSTDQHPLYFHNVTLTHAESTFGQIFTLSSLNSPITFTNSTFSDTTIHSTNIPKLRGLLMNVAITNSSFTIQHSSFSAIEFSGSHAIGTIFLDRTSQNSSFHFENISFKSCSATTGHHIAIKTPVFEKTYIREHFKFRVTLDKNAYVALVGSNESLRTILYCLVPSPLEIFLWALLAIVTVIILAIIFSFFPAFCVVLGCRVHRNKFGTGIGRCCCGCCYPEYGAQPVDDFHDFLDGVVFFPPLTVRPTSPVAGTVNADYTTSPNEHVQTVETDEPARVTKQPDTIRRHYDTQDQFSLRTHIHNEQTDEYSNPRNKRGRRYRSFDESCSDSEAVLDSSSDDGADDEDQS
ncbi:hypothetical protein BLNAU_1827 [Blattamonas nauphoetae]|uniref:Transmembrane protein n=1 Tax=Blattamonas nauphoetae TaxID=2049346 RepID=A0ABQ9YHT6_9EUKA|nr:hypothetical protein BLNAU_1827 [Blattamonas nauphoetae]